MKQKQYCNKFNKDCKMTHVEKEILRVLYEASVILISKTQNRFREEN